MNVADINLEIGPHEGRIVSQRSKMIGDKIALSFLVNVNGQEAEALVFVTEKAMGMARRALKICGFDVDQHDVAVLDVKPLMLAGNKVPLVCELYNGRKQLKIDLDGRVEKGVLSSLTKKLRDVKKGSEGGGEQSEGASYELDHGIPF